MEKPKYIIHVDDKDYTVRIFEDQNGVYSINTYDEDDFLINIPTFSIDINMADNLKTSYSIEEVLTGLVKDYLSY